jgi:hypothetical protein
VLALIGTSRIAAVFRLGLGTGDPLGAIYAIGFAARRHRSQPHGEHVIDAGGQL